MSHWVMGILAGIFALIGLLMAGAAVMLFLEVGTVQEDLEKYRKFVISGEEKKMQVDAKERATYSNALHRAANPLKVDFSQPHRVFNPSPWYADTNGVLVAGTNLGISRLTVEKIIPQELKLEFLSTGGTPGRESVSVNMTRAFARLPNDIKKRVSITVNSTNNAVNQIDPARKTMLFLREVGGAADNPEAKLEIVEPGKEPIKITISKSQPAFSMIYEYVAELYYAPEQISFKAPQRKDAELRFAGDTNIIVEITATNVLLKAVSNDKTTAKPLAPSLPATPGAKTP